MSTNNDINAPIAFSLANGGTNANLTASNGGIFYSTASAGAILAGTSTANQVLLSGASTTPAWSTATYPATTTTNQILYSSSTNTIAGLATANSGVLITSSGGVPSISSTLPTAVQTNITALGTITTGTWNGTAVSVSNGGTGNTAFTAYSVICAGTTATGTFQNVSGLGTSGQVLTSNGASALPTWQSAGAGAGAVGWNYITSATASNSATLNFDALFSSTYSQYMFVFNNLIPATNEVYFSANLGTGGTPTWVTSGYSSNQYVTNYNATATTGSNTGGATGAITCTTTGNSYNIYSTATFGGVSGYMYLNGTNN